MNKRVVLATLAGFVVSFLVGWLLWGAVCKDIYASGTMAGFQKPEEDMTWWAMMFGGLFWIILVVALFEKMGISDPKEGAITGLWIGVLIALSYNLYFWGGTNMYTNNQIVLVDILLNAVSSAIIGAVIAWMLGRGKVTTQAA